MGRITESDIRAWFQGMPDGLPTSMKLIAEYIDENVEWTLTCTGDGPLGKTSPIAGVYRSRDDWVKGVVVPLNAVFTEPLKFTLADVTIQSTEASGSSDITKAVVEIKSSSIVKKTGIPVEIYSCWVMHFSNDTKKAIRVRAYMDSAAVKTVMEG